jgi:hypothetical protein
MIGDRSILCWVSCSTNKTSKLIEFFVYNALIISSAKKLVWGKEWIESGEYYIFSMFDSIRFSMSIKLLKILRQRAKHL